MDLDFPKLTKCTAEQQGTKLKAVKIIVLRVRRINFYVFLLGLGTYTVVKECIAESAHYSTFPRKVYDLEKECDVVKVEGLEVAYCVCRLVIFLAIFSFMSLFFDKNKNILIRVQGW
jgi:hypothetical protein